MSSLFFPQMFKYIPMQGTQDFLSSFFPHQLATSSFSLQHLKAHCKHSQYQILTAICLGHTQNHTSFEENYRNTSFFFFHIYNYQPSRNVLPSWQARSIKQQLLIPPSFNTFRGQMIRTQSDSCQENLGSFTQQQQGSVLGGRAKCVPVPCRQGEAFTSCKYSGWLVTLRPHQKIQNMSFHIRKE